MDQFELLVTLAKIAFVIVVLLQVVPIMVWIERRGSALMQNRLGPNRLGPLGLIQSLADVVKFVFKEDLTPGHVEPFFWMLAPIVAIIPAFMTCAVIPFASSIVVDGREIVFQIANLDVGFLYIFSIASLGVYGIMMAGWASNNKYALLGSVRSSAQMISYELSMGLSIVGIIMIFGSMKLGDIARAQGEILLQLGPVSIPKWGIFVQPVGFIAFLTAIYAETNRLPFDLPEGESELVAGFHLEYGAMKFALFFMAEYLNMTVGSAMATTLFFGGWQLLPGMEWIHGMLGGALGLDSLGMEWLRILFEFTSFSVKVGFFMWLFVWVRWTLPRFRYDQLMNLGWKVMFPIAMANTLVTGILVYLGVL